MVHYYVKLESKLHHFWHAGRSSRDLLGDVFVFEIRSRMLNSFQLFDVRLQCFVSIVWLTSSYYIYSENHTKLFIWQHQVEVWRVYNLKQILVCIIQQIWVLMQHWTYMAHATLYCILLVLSVACTTQNSLPVSIDTSITLRRFQPIIPTNR